MYGNDAKKRDRDECARARDAVAGRGRGARGRDGASGQRRVRVVSCCRARSATRGRYGREIADPGRPGEGAIVSAAAAVRRGRESAFLSHLDHGGGSVGGPAQVLPYRHQRGRDRLRLVRIVAQPRDGLAERRLSLLPRGGLTAAHREQWRDRSRARGFCVVVFSIFRRGKFVHRQETLFLASRDAPPRGRANDTVATLSRTHSRHRIARKSCMAPARPGVHRRYSTSHSVSLYFPHIASRSSHRPSHASSARAASPER